MCVLCLVPESLVPGRACVVRIVSIRPRNSASVNSLAWFRASSTSRLFKFFKVFYQDNPSFIYIHVRVFELRLRFSSRSRFPSLHQRGLASASCPGLSVRHRLRFRVLPSVRPASRCRPAFDDPDRGPESSTFATPQGPRGVSAFRCRPATGPARSRGSAYKSR